MKKKMLAAGVLMNAAHCSCQKFGSIFAILALALSARQCP
jgi:hypothetical protein